MKKASEYRKHAEECRTLAARMETGKDRDQLLEMAAMWDRMADDRSKLVNRHPELGRAHHPETERAGEPGAEISAPPTEA